MGYHKTETKIDFVLQGELAQYLIQYMDRGLFSSKPEAVRSALRKLFQDLEDREFQRARMNMIQ